jgi:hypothetical protein
MSDKSNIIKFAQRIITEDLQLYTIGIFIKSNKSIISKHDLSNRLRAIPSVLTVKPIDDDRLVHISDGDTEYNYFIVKYISSHNSPKEDLAYMQSYISNGQDDVNLDKITGITKLDFRMHTLTKL